MVKEKIQNRLDELNGILFDSIDILTEESARRLCREINETKHRLKQIEKETGNEAYLLQKYFKYTYEKDCVKTNPALNLFSAMGLYCCLLKDIEDFWHKNKDSVIDNPGQSAVLFLSEKYPESLCFNEDPLSRNYAALTAELFYFLSDFSDTEYSFPYFEFDTGEDIHILRNDIKRFYKYKKYIENYEKTFVYWRFANDFFYRKIVNEQIVEEDVDFSEIDKKIEYIQNLKDDGVFCKDYTFEDYRADMQNKLQLLLKMKEETKNTVKPIADEKILRPREAKELDVIKKPTYIKYENLLDDEFQFYLLIDLQGKINDCTDIILLQNADVNYNKHVINDFFKLYDLILKGEYFWYDETIKLDEFYKNEMLKLLVEESRVVYIAYALYQYTGQIDWFLKTAYSYCKYTVDGEYTFEENDLALKYTKLLQEYFSKIKEKNALLEDEINELNTNGLLKKPLNLHLTSISSFPKRPKNSTVRCGQLVFHKNIANDPAYTISNATPFNGFFIQYAHMLFFCKPKENMDSSYYDLIEFLGKPMFMPSHWILKKLPDNTDFSFLLETIKLLKRDNDIKYAHKQILDNKEQLYFLSYIGTLILDSFIDEDIYDDIYFNAEEIKRYCYQKKRFIDKDEKDKQATLEKSIETCNTINAFHMFLKTKLDALSSPESFAKYSRDKNTLPDAPDLTLIFDEIFEQEVSVLKTKIKEWDTYNPEKVKERFMQYYNSLKPKFSKLSNDINLDNAIIFIATGEAMYDSFVTQSIELGDYGSLAINYYKALECILNEIFYKPYYKFIENKNDLSTWIDNSHIMKGDKLKDSLELGTFIELYKRCNREKMINFYELRGIDYEKLRSFVKKLYDIRNLRNNCAHPNLTSLASAVRGRNAVYERKDEELAIQETKAKNLYELIFNIGIVFK